MLEVKLSRFRLRQRMLADALSLSIPARKIHALTGPNGCGKTLLLDAISGIGKAEGADCSVGGLRLSSRSASARWQMGIRRLFQAPVLPASLTVDHVVRESGGVQLDHVHQLLTALGISKSCCLAELSFGQSRIVELSATAGASRAILLDEPFAGISESHRPAVHEFIRKCAESGPAILCIDHLNSSDESFYERIHHWPTVETEADRTGGPEGPEAGFPHEVLDSPKAVRTTVAWSIDRVQAGTKLLATEFRFSAAPGAILLIMGGNGSGKSTLVRALSGIPQPASSLISSTSRSIASRDLMFSPQPPKLVPELSIQQNLSLMISRSFTMGNDSTSKVGRLLQWLSASPLQLNTLAGNISGGEQALCALVGGILSNRQVIVMDEPLEALSRRAQERAICVIREAAKSGQSFILTAHVTTAASLGEFRLLKLDQDAPLTGDLHLNAAQIPPPRT